MVVVVGGCGRGSGVGGDVGGGRVLVVGYWWWRW